jgi:transposase
MKTVSFKPQSDRQLDAYLAEATAALQGTALVRITLDAIQAVDCSALPQRSGSAQRPWEVNPRTLMTVLTYCYAVGLYNPEDIQDAIQEDQALAYLAARTYPEAVELRRFRREHRSTIREALIRVLERVWVTASLGVDPTGLEPHQWTEVLNRAELSPDMIVRLGRIAEERILLALLWDGPAMHD